MKECEKTNEIARTYEQSNDHIQYKPTAPDTVNYRTANKIELPINRSYKAIGKNK